MLFGRKNWKYILDLLSEIEILSARPVDTLLDSRVKLDVESDEVFDDVRHYRRLVGKQIYLVVTHLDITYAVLVSYTHSS